MYDHDDDHDQDNEGGDSGAGESPILPYISPTNNRPALTREAPVRVLQGRAGGVAQVCGLVIFQGTEHWQDGQKGQNGPDWRDWPDGQDAYGQDGQDIRVLERKVRSPGTHRLAWNGRRQEEGDREEQPQGQAVGTGQ